MTTLVTTASTRSNASAPSRSSTPSVSAQWLMGVRRRQPMGTWDIATRWATPPSTCAVLFTDAPNVVSSIKDHSATTRVWGGLLTTRVNMQMPSFVAPRYALPLCLWSLWGDLLCHQAPAVHPLHAGKGDIGCRSHPLRSCLGQCPFVHAASFTAPLKGSCDGRCRGYLQEDLSTQATSLLSFSFCLDCLSCLKRIT
jgi:hypothetical protein